VCVRVCMCVCVCVCVCLACKQVSTSRLHAPRQERFMLSLSLPLILHKAPIVIGKIIADSKAKRCFFCGHQGTKRCVRNIICMTVASVSCCVADRETCCARYCPDVLQTSNALYAIFLRVMSGESKANVCNSSIILSYNHKTRYDETIGCDPTGHKKWGGACAATCIED